MGRPAPRPSAYDDRVWVGLDVAEAHTNYCIIDADGAVVREGATPTDVLKINAELSPLLDRLAMIGVEAGVVTHLARQLTGLNLPVAVFDAKRAKRFLSVRRNKTDALDARGIADLARLGGSIVSQVHVKGVTTQQLQSRIHMRERINRQRLSMEAYVASLVCLFGGRRSRTKSGPLFRHHMDCQLDELEAVVAFELRCEVSALLDVIDRLREIVDRIDRELTSKAKALPICRTWMEIPGVGPMTALAFYAAVENPARFRSTASIGSYFGLVPLRHQSGAYEVRKGISRHGNKRVRTLLVSAATSALRSNTRESPLKTWGLDLAGRAGKKKAHIAVARKLAVMMLSLWKSGRAYEPVLVGMTEPS